MNWNLNNIKLNNMKNKLSEPIILCLVISLCLNLTIEIMSRGSILHAFHYLITDPLVFLYNSLIISATLSIALFFKRRNFAFFLLSLLWLIIGLTDFILLQFRTTPFTAVDILMIKSALAIWKYYFKFYHLILIVFGIALVIAACIYLWRKIPSAKVRYPILKSVSFFIATFVLALALTKLGLRVNLLAANFGNLANAYHDYGLPYCFVNSVINTGIDRPDKYSEEAVGQLVDAVESGEVVNSDNTPVISPPLPTVTPIPSPTPAPTAIPKPEDKYPNIIMVQLESFFDPTLIKDISYTADPIPTFHKLQESFSSGFLNVPSVGAGTANTEFEVITGMNLDFFGPGEYPYKTILKKTTCESVNYNLKPLGYSTHAIHNNTGTFYDRYQVFSQLGFDTFTSIEYMSMVKRNPTNWAKDSVLTSQIEDTLQSTEGKDFIYTISVQGHGSYPTEDILKTKLFDLSLPEELESLYYPLLYYSHQIHEMDQFIKELTDYLNTIEEDTLLIMYGDHLPGFQLTDENLQNGSLFQTPYVIWSNFELEKVEKDVEAYQLYSYVLGRIGISNGLITKFHQTQQDSDIYLDDLKLLEYDMLYGELNCYDGVNPFNPTDLQMGIRNISITDATNLLSGSDNNYNGILVTGVNFTPYSKIYINDEYVTTIYKDENTLFATDVTLSKDDIITVKQSCEDMVVLSSTEPFIYNIEE